MSVSSSATGTQSLGGRLREARERPGQHKALGAVSLENHLGMPSKKKTCRFKDIVPIRGGRGPAKPQLRKFLQLGHKIDGEGGSSLISEFSISKHFKIFEFWGCMSIHLTII